MMKKLVFTLVIAALSILGYAKGTETKTITGQVTELVNGSEKPVALAYIYCDNTIYTSYTNDKGEFSIDVPKGKHEIKVAFKGYTADSQKINSQKANNLKFELQPIKIAEK